MRRRKGALKQCGDPLGYLGSNLPHLAGGESLLGALRAGVWRRLENLRLELEAVGSVGNPVTGRRYELACPKGRYVAYDGDEVALAARFIAQDSEAAICVAKRHALNGARQRVHGPCHGNADGFRLGRYSLE